MTELDRQNAAIRAHCEALGYSFKPWQPVPWETETPAPPAWATGNLWAAEWPKVYRLRLKILDELAPSSHRWELDREEEVVSRSAPGSARGRGIGEPRTPETAHASGR